MSPESIKVNLQFLVCGRAQTTQKKMVEWLHAHTSACSYIKACQIVFHHMKSVSNSGPNTTCSSPLYLVFSQVVEFGRSLTIPSVVQMECDECRSFCSVLLSSLLSWGAVYWLGYHKMAACWKMAWIQQICLFSSLLSLYHVDSALNKSCGPSLAFTSFAFR